MAAGIRRHFDLAYGPHGQRNLLDLYLPAAGPNGAPPPPLVLCIHGGGWRGGDKRAFRWMGEDLARRGFAAASLTYRFWPEAPFPAQLDDAQRAVRWLRHHSAHYGYDPGRVGAIGGSAGAHLSAFLALVDTEQADDPSELNAYSSRVSCVVDCYGPVDLHGRCTLRWPATGVCLTDAVKLPSLVRTGMMSNASAPIVLGLMAGRPLEGNEDAYRAASPHHAVFAQQSETPPPFLVVHGTADIGAQQGQVPFQQSERFVDALRGAYPTIRPFLVECERSSP